jgi:HK97 gp10 family phage protein
MGVVVKVRRNRIPAVVKMLQDVEKTIIDDAGGDLTDQLKAGAASAWGSRNVPASTTTLNGRPPNHATIAVGLNRGRGFYSRFLNWGTANNKANPMVDKKAHNFEPRFANIARKHLRKACDAR